MFATISFHVVFFFPDKEKNIFDLMQEINGFTFLMTQLTTFTYTIF